ncbi:MAG TPA: hypothetical protein VK422_00985 [Pyrinomonadaceae bacterium]|nr:hypothetical protein [Pyrinomonadaceae bacterium]
MTRQGIWKAVVFALLFSLQGGAALGAGWETQSSGVAVRLRGVSAVSERIAWASGERGTYLRTIDGGRTWKAGVVAGAEEMDFRDVDAFDAETAYLLSIGPGDRSRIYKTTDGGGTWELQFKNTRPEAFFDAMAFWNPDHGVAVSDPVGGRFLVIRTSDGGRTWEEMPAAGMPPALEGEGAFAASGTCIAVGPGRRVWFGTGGPAGGRVFRSEDGGRTWEVSKTPFAGGKAAGVFSVAFRDVRRGVIVGGDYTKEGDARDNVAVTDDGGKTWRLPRRTRPRGYRSCVAYMTSRRTPVLVAAGPTGTDYSQDGGDTWAALGAEGFHSVSFVPRQPTGWGVGEKGSVARYKPR